MCEAVKASGRMWSRSWSISTCGGRAENSGTPDWAAGHRAGFGPVRPSIQVKSRRSRDGSDWKKKIETALEQAVPPERKELARSDALHRKNDARTLISIGASIWRNGLHAPGIFLRKLCQKNPKQEYKRRRSSCSPPCWIASSSTL